MGLRSWLTPVTTKKEWDEVNKSIDENPYANGLHYVLKITDHENKTPFEEGDIIVAWSGDGSSSVDELKPVNCRNKTWLLDNLLDEYPEFHDEPGGPGKYGTFFTSEKEVEESF